MMCRYPILAAVLLALVFPVACSAAPCRRGRFLFQRDAVVQGGPATLETLSVAPSQAAISLGCRGVKPALVVTRRGTSVTASWARCTDVLDRNGRPARLKLKGFIAAPGCDTLTGSVIVRRATPRRRQFTAALSRCGDGYLDTQGGEQCGDAGATCPAGTACTATCTCEVPRSVTTTTTRTSTSTSTTLPGTGFTCTEVLGFSQTLQWWEQPQFQQQVDDARWQARLHAGGDVDYWANPSSDAWNGPPSQATCTDANVGLSALCSPCASGSDAPDRVLITITLQAYESDVQVWAQKIRAAIATIRQEHPQVRQIVLQPVVGGPGGAVCPVQTQTLGVRASYNAPYIVQAIASVLGDSPDLAAGYVPEVQSCADYLDDIGHLDPSARGPIGLAIGQYYGP
jgi:hypothetical protein